MKGALRDTLRARADRTQVTESETIWLQSATPVFVSGCTRK
jgi:hypothetical protein